jgi:hypothetical protein
VCQHQLELALRIEGRTAGQHFIEHGADRVKIAALIQIMRALYLFGRGVARVAHHRSAAVSVAIIELSGERIIGQLPDAIGTGEDILGSDVAVNHLQLMTCGGRGEHLASSVESLLPGQWAKLQALRKRNTFEQFGGHHQLTFQRQRGKEGDDVGASESCSNPHLADETLSGVLIVARSCG